MDLWEWASEMEEEASKKDSFIDFIHWLVRMGFQNGRRSFQESSVVSHYTKILEFIDLWKLSSEMEEASKKALLCLITLKSWNSLKWFFAKVQHASLSRMTYVANVDTACMLCGIYIYIGEHEHCCLVLGIMRTYSDNICSPHCKMAHEHAFWMGILLPSRACCDCSWNGTQCWS